MNRTPFSAIAIIAASLTVLGGMALGAQDRFTLKVPNGPAFSEFKGYETWQDVAVSQTENGLKVFAANAAMINAYRQGTPGNGRLFPNGSKIVKIEWSPKKEPRVPLFRDGAGHSEIGFVHRERFQAVPGLGRMGICPVSL
jgi:Cytochrome P460